MPIKIGTESKIYSTLMEDWKASIALMGGLKSLKRDCTHFLPKHPKETDEGYKFRVKVSNLYNVFRRTVRSLSSKPFSKPIKIESLPAELEIITKDVDRAKLSITQFGREVASNILEFGLTHILVDMPQFIGELNKAQERLLNIHPYFTHIRPDDLIYWSFVPGLTGEMVLSEIHFKMEEVDDDNEEWNWIYVWTRDEVRTYKRKKNDKDKDYELVSSNPNMLGEIPLVSIYSDVSKRGLMQADSPLQDLADLNVRHYRSQSDQDHCLHFARVPFLHFAGFSATELNDTIAVNNAFSSSNPQSKISWIETTGASLAQGSKDLEQLEARMDVMGADLLVQRPGNPTATAKAIDSAEKTSDLQAITQAIEDGLRECFIFAGKWINLKVDPESVKLSIFKDFGMSVKDKAELDLLLKARLAGELSRELWLREISRRGITDEFDVQQEMNALALEDSANVGV